MNSCVSLCLLVAVLAAGVLAQNPQPQEMAPRRDQRAVQRLDGDPRANLGALLARYVQHVRKAPSGRIPPAIKNLQNLHPTHRISDRDYMGWMDFGRRSAEEYE
ncbi:cholecystokinin [Suncus etruscus]|uniref:cholecystokinin n=1 Tax=Suncus etruscus TaxID=109475 RepID=UPI0021106A9A|nr:cholecystokinin [Suncus etruscus]